MWTSLASAGSVTFTVDADGAAIAIPRFAYGANQDLGVNEIPFYRQGGNRMTGYNWENNCSNAGNDWYHVNDFYLLWIDGMPPDYLQQPATVFTHFFENCKALGADALITLQLGGYVSADAASTVTVAEAAPSNRWKQIVVNKGSAFSLTPDTTDGYVYLDELVHFLDVREGPASAGGVKYYSLDNEPALWPSTHPRIHPAKTTYEEIKNKGVSVASMVTSLEPGAEIFGPVLFGWSAYTNLQNAPDASSEGSGYSAYGVNFINYYLDKMREASEARGRRLLHYLDVHWYPEATGSNGVSQVRITQNDVSPGVVTARMQAPRSLWDPSFTETSWITQNTHGPITLISRLQQCINRYYSGTQLAITEYDYGAPDHISGGIAQADVLGILGKYGVAGARWGWASASSYVSAAYRLYLNYDGVGSRFGDLSLPASTSSVTLASVYAARDTQHPGIVTVIALNKDLSNPTTVSCNLSLGARQIVSTRAFRFGPSSSSIVPVATASFTSSGFTDALPALSATLYELTLDGSLPTPIPTSTPTVTPTYTNTPAPTGTPAPLPEAVSAAVPWPNPWPDPAAPPTSFSGPGTIWIRVTLGQPAEWVHLRLFTISSRLVREQRFDPAPANVYDFPFLLKDDYGDPLSNGVYNLQILTNAGKTNTKILILK